MGDTTNSLEMTKRTNSSTREGLEREKEFKSTELRQTQQRIQQKNDQVKSATRAGEGIRKRMIREIEEMKSEISKTASKKESESKAMKSEFTQVIEEKERSRQNEVSAIREKVEGMSRENEHLRQIVAQSGDSSFPT